MATAHEIAVYALNQGVGFIIGIASSLIASTLLTRRSARHFRKQFGSMVGVWVEANDVLTDRPFSICEFFFSHSDGKLVLKGDSYDNSGNRYYEWWSVFIHIDRACHRMSYVYETQRVNDTKKDEGFGCYTLSMNSTKNRWDITGGYFQDLAEARPRKCRMIRFEDVASHLKLQLDPGSTQDRQVLVKELMKQKDKQRIVLLFGWNH